MTRPRSSSDTAEAAAALASLPPPGAIDLYTKMIFPVPPARAWDGLMFYEQLDQRPPFYLRLLLPVPIRTEGRKSEVGDEALCLYEGGHLIKRVTQVEREQLYKFDVVKQELDVGGGMRLSGGFYSLRELPGDRTEVTAFTRYSSPKRPRWLFGPLEAMVGHLFHRHILAAMRRAVKPA